MDILVLTISVTLHPKPIRPFINGDIGSTISVSANLEPGPVTNIAKTDISIYKWRYQFYYIGPFAWSFGYICTDISETHVVKNCYNV